MISLIHHFEADFQWKVSLKVLNSRLILKTFTHGCIPIKIIYIKPEMVNSPLDKLKINQKLL